MLWGGELSGRVPPSHGGSRRFDSCTAHPLFFIQLQKSQKAQKSLTPASRARTIGPAFFCIFKKKRGGGFKTFVEFADKVLNSLVDMSINEGNTEMVTIDQEKKRC